MGQEISHERYPPDQDLTPGTYRIFNALTGTAVQVSDHDPTKVIAWEQHDGENQQVCTPNVVETMISYDGNQVVLTTVR